MNWLLFNGAEISRCCCSEEISYPVALSTVVWEVFSKKNPIREEMCSLTHGMTGVASKITSFNKVAQNLKAISISPLEAFAPHIELASEGANVVCQVRRLLCPYLEAGDFNH